MYSQRTLSIMKALEVGTTNLGPNTPEANVVEHCGNGFLPSSLLLDQEIDTTKNIFDVGPKGPEATVVENYFENSFLPTSSRLDEEVDTTNIFDVGPNGPDADHCFLPSSSQLYQDVDTTNVFDEGRPHRREAKNDTPCDENINEFDGDFSSDDSVADPCFQPPISSSSSNEDTENNNSVVAPDLIAPATQRKRYRTNSRDSRKQRESRKILRNTGKEYTTKKGKVIKERVMRPLPLCRSKCKDKIPEDERNELFRQYWSLGDYDKRSAYISSLFVIENKKASRPRTEDPEKQKFRFKTYIYYIQLTNQRITVCRKCFLTVFDESDNFIKTLAQKKISDRGMDTSSNQGQCPAVNKWTEEKLLEVRNHILSFPSYESHYARARVNDKKYLPTYPNLTKMFQLYTECTPEPVSFKYYSKEFYKLKLSFKKPKQDTCHRCDKYEMLIKSLEGVNKQEVIEEKNAHHESAEAAYRIKREDKVSARENDSKKFFTFDLQQCLPTPALNTSVAFYKRQLWTFNLTLQDEFGITLNCMWDESTAKRGANDIGSCLFRTLLELPPQISHLVLYSDTCGGQNKNSHVVAMFFYLMQKKSSIKTIDHKFMVPGHSHMEVDVAHSMIEKQKRKSEAAIYHPHDWYQLVRSTSKTFKVLEMGQEHFFDFVKLLKGSLVARKKTEEGEDFKWPNLKWLQYRQDEPGILYFKESLREEENFRKVSFIRRGRNGREIDDPQIAYSGPVPISAEKKKDLLDLLPLIPPVFREFYEKLNSNTNERNSDPDIMLESESDDDF